MDIKTQAQEILKNVAAAKKLITQNEGAVKRLAEGKATEVDIKLMTATLDKRDDLLIVLGALREDRLRAQKEQA